MPAYTQNYVLGRGELLFNRFADNTTVGLGEHYLGNTPGFELGIEEEILEHFSSDEGLRVKDRSVTLSNDASGTLTVDNISAETISLFMAATAGDGTGSNPDFMGIRRISQAAITSAQTETITGVRLNRWYQIGLANASVPQAARDLGIGVRNLTLGACTVTQGTLIANNAANYEFDGPNGRIWIPSGGAIAANTPNVVISWQAGTAVSTVVTDGANSIFGAMRFISRNAVGEQSNYFLPYVKLTPNGNIALKGDDWQQASMNIEVLRLNSNTPRIISYR